MGVLMYSAVFKNKRKGIFIVLVLLVVLFSVIRLLCGEMVQKKIDIGRNEDSNILMQDKTTIVMCLEAPHNNLTGFSFRFNSSNTKFDKEAFYVKVINESKKEIIFEQELFLKNQVYDYQIEGYKIIVPFSADINVGDEIQTIIEGRNIAQESNVLVWASSQYDDNVMLEINGKLQDICLIANLYYQENCMDYVKVLVQGIICILVLWLAFWSFDKKKNIRLSLNEDEPYSKKDFSFKNLFLIKNLALFGILLLSLVVFFEYTYYDGVKEQANLLSEDYGFLVKDSSHYIMLEDGDSVEWDYTAVSDFFVGISLFCNNNYPQNGNLSLKIIDKKTQSIIVSIDRVIGESFNLEEKYIRLYFPKTIRDSKAKDYVVSLAYRGPDENVGLLLQSGKENAPYFGAIYKKNAFLKILFFFLCVIISVFSVIVFICAKVKVNYDKLFIISIFFLGIIFEMIFTPFSVPDESSHIDTIYRLSNKILLVEDTGISDAIYKQECDVFTDIDSKRMIGVEQYRWFYEDVFETKGTSDYVVAFAADNTNNTSEIFYLPAALGMSLGRLINVNFFGIIFFRRTFNLISALLILYYAIKRLTYSKGIIFALSFLPITIQELASC